MTRRKPFLIAGSGRTLFGGQRRAAHVPIREEGGKVLGPACGHRGDYELVELLPPEAGSSFRFADRRFDVCYNCCYAACDAAKDYYATVTAREWAT